MERVKLDTSQIPESVRMGLLDVIYAETVKYFQQPGVQERFEQWKKEREAKALREKETAAE